MESKRDKTKTALRSETEVREQLTQVQDCFRRCSSLKGRDRMKSLSSLAAGHRGVLSPGGALNAYLQSVNNFLALYRDTLNPRQVVVLKQMQAILARLKEDRQLIPIANLLDGGKAGLLSSKKYKRFLPDENGRSETDEIYLNAGGSQSHYAVTKIWKRGYDKDGKETKRHVHHYRYYYTSYNAGSGAPWAAEPVTDLRTGEETPGRRWAISTYEIYPTAWVTSPERGIRTSIEAIISAERELKKHPLLYESSRSMSVPDEDHQTHKDLSTRLGPPFSAQGQPYDSKACRVMNLKLIFDEVAPPLSEEHWLYLQSMGSNPLLELSKKELALLAELREIQQEKSNKWGMQIKAKSASAVVTPAAPTSPVAATPPGVILPGLKGLHTVFGGDHRKKTSSAKKDQSPLKFPTPPGVKSGKKS